MENKKVKDIEAAFKIQEKFKDSPNGWIQWKATNVFMMLYCKCGCSSTVSGAFAYTVKCTNCKAIYCCNGHIELTEIEEELSNTIESEI